MAGPPPRRRPHRLAAVAAAVGLAAALREWKLRENARRYGLPG